MTTDANRQHAGETLAVLGQAQQRIAELERELDATRGVQRAALRELRRLGFTVAELAAATGLTRQTVHRLLRRP